MDPEVIRIRKEQKRRERELKRTAEENLRRERKKQMRAEKEWLENAKKTRRVKPLDTIPVDLSKLKAVRIDRRTTVFVKPGQDIEKVIAQYKKTA